MSVSENGDEKSVSLTESRVRILVAMCELLVTMSLERHQMIRAFPICVEYEKENSERNLRKEQQKIGGWASALRIVIELNTVVW